MIKLKWSHGFMLSGILVGVLQPIHIMDTTHVEWYTPLIAISVGFLGLTMFLIALYHGHDFDRKEELHSQRSRTQL